MSLLGVRYKIYNLGEQPPVNRLMDFRTSEIINRFELTKQYGYRQLPWSQYPFYSIMKSPTQDELKDIGLINSFFPISQELYTLCTGGGPRGLQWPEALTQEAYHPFFCEGIKGRASLYDIPMLPNLDAPYYFGIDEDGYWGDIRYAVSNAVAFLKVVDSYPFPSPINQTPDVWLSISMNEIRDLVRQPVYLPPEMIRFWITMNLAYRYTEISEEAVRKLEKVAERKKRHALIKKIIQTAMFSALTFGIASAIAPLIPATAIVSATQIAGSITGGIQTILSTQERKEAAESLEKMAKQFQESDAAWAKELQDAAEFFDRQAAQQERQSSLTEEEEMAKQEAAQYPDKNPNPLPIIGGVAAAALLTFLLVR